MVIAVYAAICKEEGEPLCFPGTAGNHRALYQCTDALLLAKAIAWMSTQPDCGNHAFNVINGDYTRWMNLWPVFADYFGMDVGPVHTQRLGETMASKKPVWERIVARHGLRGPSFEQAVLWPYADFVFHPDSKMNVSLAGPGTPNHLGLAQFNAMLGTSLQGIYYKGAAPAVAGVVGNETQMMFISYPMVAPFVQTGRLRLLAVTSAQRSSAAPDVPTAIEAGLPGFVLEEWYGIVAPARTARAHTDRLHAELRRSVAHTETRERLVRVGADVVAGDGHVFSAHILAEMKRWDKVIKDAGIKAE